MSGRWSLGFALALGGSAAANPVPLRMVVADLPYTRVWAALGKPFGTTPRAGGRG